MLMEELLSKTETVNTRRDIRFDILRVVGIYCIILAHVDPPLRIFQLRNFDVPLMVLVSGSVFTFSYRKSNNGYFKYVLKRFTRLLLPTWIFLSFYFIFIYFLDSALNIKYPYSTELIVTSYTLESGIGYVWIIRVFILTALIAPFLLKVYDKAKSVKWYLILILTVYSAYALIYHFWGNAHGAYSYVQIKNLIYDILPFGCITALGICLPKISRKATAVMAGAFFAIFLVMAISLNSGHFVQTQEFKYPPRLYYLSYSLFAALTLYLLVGIEKIQKLLDSGFFRFISASTFWIYLWHILFIYLWSIVKNHIPGYMDNFAVRFLFIAFFATLTTFIVKYLIQKIVEVSNMNNKHRKLVQTVFLK